MLKTGNMAVTGKGIKLNWNYELLHSTFIQNNQGLRIYDRHSKMEMCALP